MTIFDKYLLKKFLYTYLLTLWTLACVITLIDCLEKMAVFTDQSLSYLTIIRYYSWGYLPFVINFIIPIVALISTVVVTIIVCRRAEIIALLSRGVPLWRCLMSYAIGAASIAVVHFCFMGWGLASANFYRVNFEATHNLSPWSSYNRQNVPIRIASNGYIYMAHYCAKDHVGTDVIIDTMQANQLVERLSGERIYWLPKVKKWQLKHWTRRTLGTLKGHLVQSGDTLILNLDLLPTALNRFTSLPETLTLTALRERIELCKARGSVGLSTLLIEQYMRYILPLSTVLLVFVGAVFTTGGVHYGQKRWPIFIGCALALLYVVCILFARSIAEARGKQLLLTLWGPNILFLLLGIMGYNRNFR